MTDATETLRDTMKKSVAVENLVTVSGNFLRLKATSESFRFV